MVRVIAHRGASRARRENTVEAFEFAAELGADGIELDVRLTLDGALIVHHDARVDGVGAIASLERDALPGHVPTLTDALDACGELFVNVEIKNSARSKFYDADMVMVRDVQRELRRRCHSDDELGLRYSVSSFDPATVTASRAADPALPTALLFDRGDPTRILRRCAAQGHAAAHPVDLLVDEVFVAQAAELELEVNVWTVDDPDRMAELVRLGVDGIITNVPDVARVAVTAATADGPTKGPMGGPEQ